MLLIGVIYWIKSSIFQHAGFGHIAFVQLGSDRQKWTMAYMVGTG